MRYALRQLLRTPSFAAIAVLTLATGIAAVTTMFAVVDELAFRPVRAASHPGVYHLGALQIPDFDILAASPPEGVAGIAAFEVEGGLLQIPGRAARVTAWRVSGGYADVLNVRPQAGRWISDVDNVGGEIDPKRSFGGRSYPIALGQLGADVAVISDRIWREWFNRSAGVVRTGTIYLDQRPVQIIGVAPAEFETSIDIWTPFGRRRLLSREELEAQRMRKRPVGWVGPLEEPRQPTIRAFIRKDANVSVATMNARLTAALRSRTSTPELPTKRFAIVPTSTDDRLVRTGSVILGFAALIFVAACANFGNMLYARATDREGELAIRLALGATRTAIVAQLLAEPFIIAGAATAVGLLLSAGALRLFVGAFPAFQMSYWKAVTLDLSLDWRVVGCAAAAGLLAAVAVSAGSLRRSSRVSLLTRIAASGSAVVAKTEGRTLRTMLVAVQISAAVLLLIATGMLLENTSKRLNRRLLFDSRQLAGATIELPAQYDESRGRHFFAQVLQRARNIKGVWTAGMTDALPGGERPSPHAAPSGIVAETPERGLSGVPRRLDGQWVSVSPGLVETLGLRILRGRDFQQIDQAGSEPVVLVSESTARKLWPSQDPLNKRLLCCGSRQARRVVGVVPDPLGAKDQPPTLDLGEAIGQAGGGSSHGVFVFLPAAQDYSRSMLLLVRSDTPGAVVQELRDSVASLDPTVPVFNAGPVNATQFGTWMAEHSVRVLAGGLGILALGIAILGVYAVVSYFVSRRTREFGLRLSLGATRGQIIKLVIDQATHMVLIGLLPAVLLASLGTRIFQVELVKIHPNDLTVWIAVPLLMLAAGVVAAYIPARRASRVEPNRALREN